MPRLQGQNLRRELELADSPLLYPFTNPNAQHHPFLHIKNGQKKRQRLQSAMGLFAIDMICSSVSKVLVSAPGGCMGLLAPTTPSRLH